MQRRVMGCTSSYEVPKFDDDLTTLCWTNSAVNNTEEVINSPEYKCEEVCRSQFSTESVLIGVGGFGTVRLVKKVHGIDEGKEYAIKTIHKATVLQKPTGVENVFTEMCCGILTQESPFISSLMYAFQDQKHLYLVFELAVGGDLRYFLRKSVFGRLSESVAKFFICQIFLALEACHQMNILHRDVKPENILLMSSGYVKLADFGVAKILTDIERCCSTSGTHGYLAPEIYQGSHMHGIAADWFAAGITLHEFVTGERPFDVQQLQAFRFSGHCDPLRLHYMNAKATFLSYSCKAIISGLLNPNSNRRLGAEGGIASIKTHPWIARDNAWELIATRQLASPCRPNRRLFKNIGDEEAIRYVQHEKLAESFHVSLESQLTFDRFYYSYIDKEKYAHHRVKDSDGVNVEINNDRAKI